MPSTTIPRTQTRRRGTPQGFNCQAAADELHQVIVHAEAMGVGQDQTALKPMVEGIKQQLGDKVFDNGCMLTADTGYSSEANMDYLLTEGIDAVVPDNP